jgi:hypothetical protein
LCQLVTIIFQSEKRKADPWSLQRN